MVGMPAADILSKLPAGFGNMMTSIGLLIVFGSIFGDFLGNSGATEELAKVWSGCSARRTIILR